MKLATTTFKADCHKLWLGLREAKQDFSWHALPMQFAVRSALAVVIALYISWLFAIDNPAWAAISAIMASQNTMGGTVSKSIFRICGTLLGGFLGFVINAYFLQNLPLYLLAGTLVCTLSFYMASRDPYYTYSWTVIAITCVLVMYSGAMLAEPTVSQVYEMFIYRTSEVIIGVICASLCAMFIFPNLSTRVARAQINEIFDAFQPLLDCINRKIQGQHCDDAFYPLFTEQAERVNNIHNLLLTIRFERKIRRLNVPYERVEHSVRNIEQAIVYAYEHIHGCTRIDLSALINAFDEVVKQVICVQISQSQCHFKRSDFNVLFDQISHFRKEVKTLQNREIYNVLSDFLNALERNMLLLCDDEASQQDVRLISQMTAWSSLDYIGYNFREAFYHGVHWRQFAIPLLYGVAVNLSVYLWAVLGWEQIATVAITICVCLTFNPEVTRYKSIQRMFGCGLGCVFAFVILALSISSTVEILLVVFAVLCFTQYIGGSKPTVAYFGLQASIPIALGVFQGLAPATGDVVALERLLSIMLGVLTVSLIEWLFVIDRPEKVMTNALIDARHATQALLTQFTDVQSTYKIGIIKYHFIASRRAVHTVRGLTIHASDLAMLQTQAIKATTGIYRICYFTYFYRIAFHQQAINPDLSDLLKLVGNILRYHRVERIALMQSYIQLTAIKNELANSVDDGWHGYFSELIAHLLQQYAVAVALIDYENMQA